MLPEGWKYSNIGEIASNVTSGSRDWAQYYSDTGDKFVRMTNLARDGVRISENDMKFVSIPHDSTDGKRTALKNGDILISITAELGKIGLVPSGFGTAFINQHLALVRLKNAAASSTFVAYALSSKKLNQKLNSLNDAGAKAGLNLSTIRSFPIILPPLPEQKKIAAILSTWDRAIERTEKLLANSQQQKKALMQQLLTGKKRLPGFTGEWNIRKFQDLFHERTETEREDLPLLSVTANDGVIFQEDSGRKNISKEDKSKYKRICVGDIGYNTMRMWQGRSCLSDKEGIVSPAYTIVFAKKNICTIFASYLFKFPPIIHVFYRHSQGLVSDTWNLKFKHFKEISWEIPPLPEQKAIAAVLTTADEEITTLVSDLSRLRQEKKALMQQLLTGKRRVTVD